MSWIIHEALWGYWRIIQLRAELAVELFSGPHSAEWIIWLTLLSGWRSLQWTNHVSSLDCESFIYIAMYGCFWPLLHLHSLENARQRSTKKQGTNAQNKFCIAQISGNKCWKTTLLRRIVIDTENEAFTAEWSHMAHFRFNRESVRHCQQCKWNIHNPLDSQDHLCTPDCGVKIILRLLKCQNVSSSGGTGR